MCCLTLILVLYFAKKIFPDDQKFQDHFVFLSIIVILYKALFVSVWFTVFYPEFVINDDAGFYWLQMQIYAEDPFSTSPHLKGYKQGMQILYASMMYLFQARTVLVPMVLNVFFAYLTAAMTVIMATKMTSKKFPLLLILLFVAIHPETTYWNGRLLRENLVLFLVPLQIYLCMMLYEKKKASTLVSLILVTLFTYFVRSQIALFVPLALSFYITMYCLRSGFKGYVFLFSLGIISFVIFQYFLSDLFVTQMIMQKISGGSGHLVWEDIVAKFQENVGKVLALSAGGRAGKLGLLLIPISLPILGLFTLSIFRRREIFGEKVRNAELVFFLASIFIMMLAATGFAGIRFRATVSQLLTTLVTITAYYYWPKFHFPHFRFSVKGHT